MTHHPRRSMPTTHIIEHLALFQLVKNKGSESNDVRNWQKGRYSINKQF